MKLAELARYIPLLVGEPIPAGIEISGITEDSRRVKPGMLFAALPGAKADGMAFAADAVAKGALAILAGEAPADSRLAVPVLRTREPRRSLALMAARFAGLQPKTIVAVTGTNGKTSVAAFLRQIWDACGHEAASLGTIGIVTAKGETPLAHTTPDPVTLHTHLAELARNGITHLALEASSHGLAQYRLDGVALAAGAFTNITRDHLDYHLAFEDYLNAKLRLFRELLLPGQPAIIDADSPGADRAIEAAQLRGLKIFTVGRAGQAITLKNAERDGFRQNLTLVHADKTYIVHFPLAGDFQISNGLVAAGLAIALGGNPEAVFLALETLHGAKGRLEHAGETESGAPVFIDYAHTPDALVKALEALRPYVSARLHVVFGCGGDRDPGKRPQMGEAAVHGADVVYVTDDNPRTEDPGAIRRAILAAAPEAIEVDDRAKAVGMAISNLKRGDVLLVAGKGHETGQIIGTAVIPYSDHEAVAAALAVSDSCARKGGHG